MLSDSISDRTLLLLFLDAVEFFAALNNTCISARTLVLLFLNCITTMHMNYSLFTLRSSLNLSYPPEHYPCCFSTTIPYKEFPITTKHFIIGLRRTSIPNFHFPIFTSQSSILTSQFSIIPPFIPPRNTIAKSAETSKKC